MEFHTPTHKAMAPVNISHGFFEDNKYLTDF